MTKLLALLALSSLALTACGSSEDPAAKGPDDSDAARVKFEQCLRDNGINVQSEPASGGSSGGATRVRMKAGKGSPAKFERIQEDCREKSGFKPEPPSEAEQAEFRDAALKFARCMRANGINMPDPQVGPGGGGIIMRAGRGGVNPESPRFRQAERECQKFMPRGKMQSKAP